MMKLFELIKKNFRLLVRSKASSLVIFIGPLLLVSLLGLAYSQSNSFALSASVYSDSYTELAESLITKMTNQNFLVTRQGSVDDCVGAVKRKESQACVVFPPQMAVSDSGTNEITFYVDYSQINLVWLMLDVMSARVSERSTEISKELTSDLLSRMLFVEESIKSGQATLDTMSAESSMIKETSSGMRSGFQKLDISVNFNGLDVEGSKSLSDNTSSLVSGIREMVAALKNGTEHPLSSIESSVTAVKAEVNDSALTGELDDIDDAADDIEEAIGDATAAVETCADNASAMIASVKSSLDLISLRLSETNAKIGDVKKQRDDLLPQFDSIGLQIELMMGNVNQLRGSLDEALQKISGAGGKSADSIAAPITTRIEPISTQKTHFNSLFPTLLVLVIMITGILLAATLTIVEKKSKAFFRNSITPVSHLVFSLSTYITSLMVLFIQLLLFVSISAFFFETDVLASIWLILLLIFLASTVFVFIGMLVGFIFRTEETVNLAAITLVAVFLLFSSAVIPLESLPSYLKEIAMFNPFVVSELALRQAVVFHFGVSKALHGLSVLAVYAAVLFAVLFLVQQAFRKLSFAHFERIHLGRAIVKEKKAHAEISKPSDPKRTEAKDAAEKKA
ncbi:ABC transporter permease [Candidatus Woesearchaeota archaeon]|nr:ABC transporter permease [Candidatus Woesearchaeota archaeon]